MLHTTRVFGCLLLALYRGATPEPPPEIVPFVVPALPCRVALNTLLLHNQLVVRCFPVCRLGPERLPQATPDSPIGRTPRDTTRGPDCMERLLTQVGGCQTSLSPSRPGL